MKRRRHKSPSGPAASVTGSPSGSYVPELDASFGSMSIPVNVRERDSGLSFRGAAAGEEEVVSFRRRLVDSDFHQGDAAESFGEPANVSRAHWIADWMEERRGLLYTSWGRRCEAPHKVSNVTGHRTFNSSLMIVNETRGEQYKSQVSYEDATRGSSSGSNSGSSGSAVTAGSTKTVDTTQSGLTSIKLSLTASQRVT